ncbi:hypothetical protein ZHAS_00013656 [Anopheles sinensis]|uniref:TEP1-F n=1 Tax=Anopheles sinensis TaxID=74873 RepID=A0A084W648_ANOSI|nr:hypothetical protein ZHAS_00013656 [Anopheles sinensis]
MRPSIGSLELLLVFLTSVVQGEIKCMLTVITFLQTLQVPEDLEGGSYKLSINGNRGFSYHEDVTVVVSDKTFSGLIQLNKPVYRPGETVNFRVIVLNSELKPPTEIPDISIKIKSPSNLAVKELYDIPLKQGVFEECFLIAPDPIIGTYTLDVEVDDYKLVSKTFEVKEYVLSGLNVNLSPSRVPLEEHQSVDLTVSATNVLGQPVSGTISIALFKPEERSSLGKTTKEVHGMLKLTMPLNNLFIYETSQQIYANYTFVEQYTNRTTASAVPITIFKSMYRGRLTKEFPGFRPGNSLKATIKLEHHDGSPARYVKCNVELEGTEVTQIEKETNGNGEISLGLMPLDNVNSIIVTVLVGGEEILDEEIPKAPETNALIKIMFKTDVQLDMPIKMKIKCRREMTFLMYYILAKGNVIDQGYLRLNRKSNVNIDIKYSPSMVPKAKVIVATLSGNTMVYDMKDIVYRDLLNNFNMEIENQEIKPGAQIQLDMNGRPNAFFALAAYDKSLLHYGSIHDVYWNDVQNLHNHFYQNEHNQYDFFHSNGLFARVSSNFTLNNPLSKAQRNNNEQRYVKLTPYRTNFAESFLWMNGTMDHSGYIRVIEPVPHSTTAWSLTGFSMHPDFGLGIVKQPLQFNTIKAFYIVDHLPYAVKQDEVVALQFTLFNNLGQLYITKVTLFNVQNQIEFMEATEKDAPEYFKIIEVHETVGTRVSFLVKAKKLGEMAVRVKAVNMIDTDAIEKVIRVMPKSLVYKDSQTRLFSKTDYVNATQNMTLSINKKADAGTTKISFVVEPNLLAGVMDNLEKLIDAPVGSGESNMINFVPNVAVLDYLEGIDSKHKSFERAKQLLSLGYQNQLKYRNTDGSFKVFEGSDSTIFLTAFVAKSMQTASKHLLEVDAKMVNQAFDWLASKQESDGQFIETGPIVLQELQSSSRKNIALTSYVITAFLENPNTKQNHTKVIKKGINYILRYRDEIKDSYDLALATYALTLNDYKSQDTTAFRKALLQKATMDGHLMYWDRKPHSIETTSYALLALIQDEVIIHNGILIMRWLVDQRFETGSFPRTQDTFVGLKALSKLGEVISPKNNEYSIGLKILQKNPLSHTFMFGKNDFLPHKFEDIPESARRFEINFSGKGLALVTFNYEYSLDLQNHTKNFQLTLEKLSKSPHSVLTMKICTSYIPTLTNNRSNMALVEVTFPSGYVVDNNPVTSLTTITPIQKTEIRFGATSVVVYYANMGTETNCFTITAYRRFMVSFRRPAYVIAQDFYNPEHNAIQVYKVEGESE